MKAKNQRLVLLGCALAALAGAGAIAASALGDTATYFYAPSDVAEKGVAAGRVVKVGGLVEGGSVATKGTTTSFRVTDNAETVTIRYTGIMPDLFREGQGIIAEGRFGEDRVFVADTLLAKHDENYMPPEVAGALHKTASAAE